MAEKRAYASLKSFGKGINSDVDPLLLPPDQLSFARNATMRGNFSRPRPAFFYLQFTNSFAPSGSQAASDYADFQQGLFQGACYYRTSVNGYIMLAVNGKLFQITVAASSQSATVTEINLTSGSNPPGPNNPTVPQNWMWQAAQFLIWNDGVSLPIFWDGSPPNVGVRRSLGPTPVPVGTTSALFDAPASGDIVTISLTEPWESGFGAFLIGTALYNVVGFSGGATSGRIVVGLGSIKATAGDQIASNPGTGIYLNNKYCGSIEGAKLSDGVTQIGQFPPMPVAGTPGDELVLTVISNTTAQASTIATGTPITSSEYYAGEIVSVTQNGGLIKNWPSSQPPQITVVISGKYTFSVGDTWGLLPTGTETLWCTGTIVSSVISGSTTMVVLSILNVASGRAGATLPVPGTTLFKSVVNGFPALSVNPNIVPPAGGAPSFIVTLSQNFAGSVGDILQDPNGNQMTVQAISSAAVTCQMVNNLQGSITTGSMMLNNTHQADAPTTYGSVIQTAVSIPAVGNNMTVPISVITNPAVGQIVYFTSAITGGGTGTVVASVLQVNSGTIGAVPNYFNLALSAANSASVGDNLSVGLAANNDFATFTVTSIVTQNIVQCQMTNVPTVNNLGNFITQGVPTLEQLVVNVSKGTGTTTLLGTYPQYTAATPPTLEPTFDVPSSSIFNITDIVPTNAPSFTYGQIVQVSVNSGVGTDLFMVVSANSGSTGTTPTIVAYNINDTTGNVVSNGTQISSVPELPISRMGCYGMGRNWVALADGVSYVASDIVGSSTGTLQYKFQDAVLRVSQNYFLAGGGTFQISGAGETITAMQFVAQLDASLGQGPLQIFTDETVFSNLAPTDMSTWSSLTSPIQVEGLIGSGAISQDAVVQQNNDLIFRLADGGIQSMLMASLNFNQWGNTPISKEVSRSIKNDNPNLLQYTSMVTFNNRMLMTCQFQQAARGVYGAAMVALNFDPISSLSGKAPTVWDGEWTGLNVLQLISGTFNGQKQCFALCLSSDLTRIELHQIQLDGAATQDNGAQPVAWSIESPMLFKEPENPSQPRLYKRLLNGDFSVRDITEDIAYTVSYRSDQNPNWTPWYSSTIKYAGSADPGYRRRISIGSPSPNVFDATNNQPMREGYNFQLKIDFTGSCTLTNFRVAADLIDEPEFGRPT